MQNNKQTAVEWLVEELTKQNMFMHLFAKEIEQAKQMEKEQIMDNFNDGINDECLGKNTTPKQYYEKRYGKDTNDNTSV